MQKDFHYYAIFALAKHAGFASDEAQIIASSSQYTDDSKEGDTMRLQTSEREYMKFDPIRTAWMGLESIGENVQRKVFMPFHFLPSRRASEGGERPLLLDYPVRRNGEMAAAIVDDALRERDADIRLFRLGIALHSLADTWSHEGFSGRRAKENDIESIRVQDEAGEMRPLGLFDQLARNARPDLGHIEAGHLPDRSWVVWDYEQFDRGAGEMRRIDVNNADKFLEASHACYDRLVEALNGERRTRAPKWDSIATRIHSILKRPPDAGITDSDEMCRQKCMQWASEFPDCPPYSASAFRATALDCDAPEDLEWDAFDRDWLSRQAFRAKNGFFSSDWVRFHRAALKHRALFDELRMCAPEEPHSG